MRISDWSSDVCSSDLLYACGPSGFLDFVLGAASQLGWSGSCVHREYFAAAATTSAEDQSFEVELASSGQTFHIPPDKTVLEILAENGIDIPVSCEQGICGTCVTSVLRGEPDHRDIFMRTEENTSEQQSLKRISYADIDMKKTT